MYKGTHEGDMGEIEFVKFFNENKSIFPKYLENFKTYKNIWLVRVTTKQLSALSHQKVFTRSDCYLASFENNIDNIVINQNYYLTEDFLNFSKISYIKIPYSGISVKLTDSKNYQILKVGPNSFNALFGNVELGCGASLFCSKEEELIKNENLIKGWNTSYSHMYDYFKDKVNLGNKKEFYLDKEICKKIKNFSCLEIENKINSTISLQEKIFNGKDLYEEPYTAWYFYHGKDIKKLKIIPFTVTTGSGRSKGNYTLVLKPTRFV